MPLRRHLVVGAPLAVAAAAVPARADDAPPMELVRETRTQLFLAPAEATLARLLPEGWTATPIPQGPAAGATLTLVLIERLLATGGDGSPATPPRNHLLVLAAPARRGPAERPVTLVLAGISAEPAGAPGFYGVYRPGTVALERRSGVPSAEAAEERWSVTGADGDGLALEVAWRRDVPLLTVFDQTVVSAADPGLRRRYRGEQGADLVRSLPGGRDHAGTLTLTTRGPLLGLLASADLVALTSLPWYRREARPVEG